MVAHLDTAEMFAAAVDLDPDAASDEVSHFLQSLHLAQYAHACFEGGYTWVADLADHSVEELVEDLQMKKPHAKRVLKAAGAVVAERAAQAAAKAAKLEKRKQDIADHRMAREGHLGIYEEHKSLIRGNGHYE